MGLKEQLRSAKQKIETIHVPDWGMDVYIRRMNGAERDVFQKAQLKADEDRKTVGDVAVLSLQPLLLSLTLCEVDGKRAFQTVEEVLELDGALIEVLAKKAADVNCLNDATREELEKKTLGNGSGTTSHGNSESQSSKPSA